MIITKRIVIFISAFVMAMCFCSVFISHANGSYNYNAGWYYIVAYAGGAYRLCFTDGSYNLTMNSNGKVTTPSNYVVDWSEVNTGYSSITDAVNAFNSLVGGERLYFYDAWRNTFDLSNPFIVVHIPNGRTFTTNDIENVYGSLEDYENVINPPSEPTWFDIMWDTFTDYLGNPIPFGWIKNLYDRLWGDPEDDNTIIDKVEIEDPTIAPTPTAIPYQTVVVPKIDPVTGDTYYTYEYHYNNPSGTPIVATAPPPQPTAAAGVGNGGGDYAPIGGEPYAIPDLPWLNTTITIGDDDINLLDDFGNGIDSINTIGSQYQDGMNTATESFGFLPPDWLILIGVCSAIILIGGIISRFLS